MSKTLVFDNFENGTSNWTLGVINLATDKYWSPTHSLECQSPSNQFATYIINDNNSGDVHFQVYLYCSGGTTNSSIALVYRGSLTPLSSASNTFYYVQINHVGGATPPPAAIVFGNYISGVQTSITSVSIASGTLVDKWLMLDTWMAGSSLQIQLLDTTNNNYFTSLGSWQTSQAYVINQTDSSIAAVAGYFGLWYYGASGEHVYADDFSLWVQAGTTLLPAISTLVANAIVTRNAKAALTGTATVNTSAILIHQAKASPVSVASLTGKATIIRSAKATLTSNSVVSGSPGIIHQGKASLINLTTLTAKAAATHNVKAALATASAVSATPLVSHHAKCILTPQSSLNAIARHVANGRTSLQSNATFVASGGKSSESVSNLDATSSISATGGVAHAAKARLTTASSVSANSSQGQIISGSAVLRGLSGITAPGSVRYGAKATLTSSGSVQANVSGSFGNGQAALRASSTIDAVANVDHSAEANLSSGSGTAGQVLRPLPMGRTFDYFLFNQGTFDGPQVAPPYIQAGARLVCSSTLTATAGAIIITVPSTGGGVKVGGSGAKVGVNIYQLCLKPPLPLNPKPSIANYKPDNIAPLIEFFRPIVSDVVGKDIHLCQIIMHYENNTPCFYPDDIFVPYAPCIPVPYVRVPPPTAKSPELLLYESYAKKSVALYNYMINSPARIKYFNQDVKHEILPY